MAPKRNFAPDPKKFWAAHPRPQAQAREALTVALVQAVELLDCDWFFCPKGMLRVGTKCGLTLNNGWREE